MKLSPTRTDSCNGAAKQPGELAFSKDVVLKFYIDPIRRLSDRIMIKFIVLWIKFRRN